MEIWKKVLKLGILLTIFSINSYASSQEVVKPKINNIGFWSAKWHINYDELKNGTNLLKEELFVDGSSDRVVTIGTQEIRGFSLNRSYATDVCHKAYVVVYDKSHNVVEKSDVFNFGDTSKCSDYVEVPDTVAPVLTLKGVNPQLVTKGQSYEELGAIALDNRDGDLTKSIVIDRSAVDTTTLGDYTVSYNVADTSGNNATTVTRIVKVVAEDFAGELEIHSMKFYRGKWNIRYQDLRKVKGLKKEILFVDGVAVRTLTGGYNRPFDRGFAFIGAYAQDACHKAYIVAYDNDDNNLSQSDVFEFGDTSKCGDMVKPVITLVGEATVTLNVGETYSDAGAIATDDIDGDITSDINMTSTVNMAVAGTYTVTYNVKDSAGNEANEVSRTVNVITLVVEQGSLVGRVVDISGNAIVNVLVQVNGVARRTNDTGNFIFNEVNASNRIIVNVSHSDYLNNSKIVQVQKDLETTTTIVLAQENARRFSSTAETTVEGNGGGELILPADIYVDREGNSFSGEVKLSLNYYPISTPQGREMFPGNFDAINSSNERGTLRSYGFVTMSLEDSLGNELGINGSANITIPADLSLGTPPATIPLWYYDEDRGIWVEDGVATYDEATQSYQGAITRIAVYNLDVFMSPGNLKVCVEDTNGTKLSGAYVRLESPSINWFGQVGPTNSTGYINIVNVMGNTNINLSAYLLDGRYGLYSNNPITITPNIDNELPSCIVVADGNATLTGVVQELGTGTKLSGVKVVLRTGGVYIREVLSDENGVYSFTHLSGGGLVYSLEYTKEEYNPNSYSNIHLDINQVKTLETTNLSKDVAIINGEVSGVVSNVLTGQGVSTVTLKVREGMNNQNGVITKEIQTLTDGSYTMTLIEGIYTVEAIKNGYITSYFTITVIGGAVSSNQNGTLSPTIVDGDMRIVLTWGASPGDLDSHLVRKTDGVQDYHVYFSHSRSADANLDHDDTSSYGPETVTINSPQQNSIYTYYVYNYSGGSADVLKNSNAKVTVAFNNTQRTFNIPNEGGRYWKVFEIENGAIIPCSVGCVQNSIITRGRSLRKVSRGVSSQNISNHMSKEEALSLFRNLPSK